MLKLQAKVAQYWQRNRVISLEHEVVWDACAELFAVGGDDVSSIGGAMLARLQVSSHCFLSSLFA